MKFKVGDKVKIIDLIGYHNPEIIKNMTGKIVQVDDNGSTRQPYRVQYTDSIDDTNWFREEELEILNKKPTKDELFAMPNGTKVTTDLNSEFNVFYKVDGEFRNDNGDWMSRCDIENSLAINEDTYGTKIIKIEKPVEYETVYDHSNEIKEMTIADIEKALGHPVKIVKEAE